MGGSQGRGRGAARGCRGRRGLAPEQIWKEPWEFDVKGGWEQTHKPLSVQSGEALGLLRRRILGGRSSTVWDRVWAECGPDQNGKWAGAGMSPGPRTGKGLLERPGALTCRCKWPCARWDGRRSRATFAMNECRRQGQRDERRMEESRTKRPQHCQH